MNLRDLQLSPRYSSKHTDLLREVWIPLLSVSVFYKRGVGYFRSDHLASAAQGLSKFIQNGGKAQLICGIQLKEDDVKAISMGYEERQRLAARKIQEELRKPLDIYHLSSLGLLGWMIKNNILDIKIAVRRDNGSGIFHSKFGICYDSEGNKVVFEGSANETPGGLINNRESISLDVSWNGDPWITQRIDSIENDFDRLWENDDNEYDVVEFPEAAKNELIRLAPQAVPHEGLEEMGWRIPVPRNLEMPNAQNLVLRNYQKDCVDAWIQAGYRGMVEMATGTGKTITAIACMSYLTKSSQKQTVCIIITVPYVHLVEQWDLSLQNFGFKAIKVYGQVTNWRNQLGDEILSLNNRRIENLVILTTHNTFSSNGFRFIIGHIRSPIMLIADEVHAVGSEIRREGLLKEYSYRLGLSATPKRYFDEEGTDYLYDYFGNVIYEFTLERAIREKFLVPYEYHPFYVSLTQEELQRYRTMTKKIAVQYSGSSSQEDLELLKLFTIQRQKIIVNAENKLRRFKKLIDEIRNSVEHCLIYCSENQIDHVQRILNDYPIVNQRVTYRESVEERSEYFRLFVSGVYKAIVAINVLDEGLDIPSTAMAIILASSGNPKQYVQRRGRVLRTYPGKEKAIIYDIFVIPELNDPTTHNMERKIVQKELKRHEEMASIAINREDAMAEIANIRKKFGLS